MLALKPNCECCDTDLPPSATNAYICSFECTFCDDCVSTVLNGICPNCGGKFSQRPIRPTNLITKYPPSNKRVLKQNGCQSLSH